MYYSQREDNMTKEIEIPDGQGGMKKVIPDGVHPWKTFEGQDKRFIEEQEKAAWERIGHAAESFNAFHKAYATDHGLTQEELIGAAYLENLNLREFYPQESGGPKAYDEVCKRIWQWFELNKNK